MNTHDISVCEECIGDKFLKKFVATNGQYGTCFYCSNAGKILPLPQLGDRIHRVLQSQFFQTEKYPENLHRLKEVGDRAWVRDGMPLVKLISDITGLKKNICKKLHTYLHDTYCDPNDDYLEMWQESPYDLGVYYEETDIGSNIKSERGGFHHMWKDFMESVSRESRFFNKKAKNILDTIFCDLENIQTRDGVSAISSIDITSDDRFVFRGRTVISNSDIEKILTHPAQELGPPPSNLAPHGRMNAMGISVFYGAQNKKTCISELRAPVGSSIVLGKFELIRPVRLLNLDALSSIYAPGSHFDPNYPIRHERACFLAHLSKVITRPIMPGDEALDYLPTQVIAEYLQTNANLDGMLFPSHQTGEKSRNLILFNHARIVEADEVSSDIETRLFEAPKEEGVADRAIIIVEHYSRESKEKEVTSQTRKDYSPTLRLDKASIQISHITAVEYNTRERETTHVRIGFKDEEEEEPRE